jgi:tRNA nucleotidyltransferase (CCA-adding enzyme)
MITKRQLRFPGYKIISPIVNELSNLGYSSFIVGGSVRDILLGQEPKDLDIEVFGLALEDLKTILESFGEVDSVGAQFGILKLKKEGVVFDFSVPRIDIQEGVGHKEVLVDLLSTMTPLEASLRRDFTINALMYDPLKEEIHDYHHGLDHIHRKILKHTSDLFKEDPLRVLRGIKFSCRFGFELSEETIELCREMKKDYEYLLTISKQDLQKLLEDKEYKGPRGSLPSGKYLTAGESLNWIISRERVYDEFVDIALKGKFPDKLLFSLENTGWLKFFPELYDMVFWPEDRTQYIPQDPIHHPEGFLIAHVSHCLKACRMISERENLDKETRILFFFSTLCHDLAKATTTKLREGRWTSYGHEEKGGALAQSFLRSINSPRKVEEKVIPLVKNHLCHIHFKHCGKNSPNPEKSRKSFLNKLSTKLSPATLEEMALLIEADCSGRPPLPPEIPGSMLEMLELSKTLDIMDKPLKPLVQGRDILHLFKEKGPLISETLKACFEAQKEEEFSTVEDGVKWVENYLLSRGV